VGLPSHGLSWAPCCTHPLHASLPAQINISEFKERARPQKDYIHAQVMVERESQVRWGDEEDSREGTWGGWLRRAAGRVAICLEIYSLKDERGHPRGGTPVHTPRCMHVAGVHRDRGERGCDQEAGPDGAKGG